MAYTGEQGLQGDELDGAHKGEVTESQGSHRTTAKRSDGGWPSRPGRAQHGWEEPRVVGNPKAVNGKQSNRETSESGGAKEEDRGHGGNKKRRKAQSELGRATYGAASGVDPIANRVDRLRLLGNGVVPGTCERAIRILLEKIHD